MPPRAASVARCLRSRPALLARPSSYQLRHASSEPSNHTNFYKTFGRPIAKVLLMAILTYQLAYLGWTKLDQDQLRDERQAEITTLEERVKALRNESADRRSAPSGDGSHPDGSSRRRWWVF